MCFPAFLYVARTTMITRSSKDHIRRCSVNGPQIVNQLPHLMIMSSSGEPICKLDHAVIATCRKGISLTQVQRLQKISFEPALALVLNPPD